MAYDETLADRIRTALHGRDDVEERKMFGGITFMVAGRMACGVIHDDLMVKVGAEGHPDALAEPHTRPMDFRGDPRRAGRVDVDHAAHERSRSRALGRAGRDGSHGRQDRHRRRGKTQHSPRSIHPSPAPRPARDDSAPSLPLSW
jgi:TfoX N-terminal domain